MQLRISNSFNLDWYSYLYFLMVVLYSAQPGGLNGFVNFNGVSLLVFLIPPIMTIILLRKNHVNFLDKRFLLVLLFLSIWFIAQYFYRKGSINLTLTLFHYYQMSLCFIVVQVFRDKLFWIYEDIVYKLGLISLLLWFFSLIAPHTLASVMHLFHNGDNITEGSAFVYTMMRIDRVTGIFIRNAGFAWEPGRYACFLCLAIFCNFMNRGFSVNKNRRFWVFIIALLTTQSTTGIFTLIFLLFIFLINQKFKYSLFWTVLIIPLILALTSLDFALYKAQKSLEKSKDAMEITNIGGQDGYSLDRFESLVIEWNNFLHDPIIGYCEPRYSYFEQNIGTGFFLNNGSMQLLAKYGILGLFYYLCVLISSKRIALIFRDKMKYSYLFLFLFIGMGYNFYNIVIVMAFSFWAIFVPKRILNAYNYNQ